MIVNEILVKAHEHCSNNQEELSNSKVCGCFYCERIFKPKEIKEWVRDDKLTAQCPYCGVDSVIGDASGYTITKKFLKSMHKEWF